MFAINACAHDLDLDSGRVLTPGERATIPDSPRHRDMVTDGLLRVLPLPPGQPSPDPAASGPVGPAQAPPRPTPPAEPQATPPVLLSATAPAGSEQTETADSSVVLAPAAPAADTAAPPQQES